ncbi:MFS transporter [Vibrio sp. SCSIO 43136]|uniref:MDR family MFS transporter n=1 Tax=Vibrio sp. SCSIO 43136 TaxID=2819101 RepID=UPI002074F179|nr:MFS transporter [Vibrio sp. SCSIO 43136]USD66926.1 MFS transporter [Vibrio sp. SCSIO 43136]
MENQESLFKVQRVKRFTRPVWIVLIGTLLARTSYFMAWPFLIVFLYQDYGASEVTIGSMLAMSALISGTTGLYSGYLSDKFGRKSVMVLGSIIASLAYTGIGLADQIWQFFILLMMTGLMRPMIEAPSKAVISDCLDDSKDRELALNIRYFLLNLGGAIGPLIGITLALAHPQNLFLVCGLVYIAYALWMFVGIPSKDKTLSGEGLPSFRATIGIIKNDQIFVYLLLANFIMLFVYAQYESSIPQVIVRSSIEESAKLVAGLVLINTMTIIIFQFPMLKLLEKVPLFKRTRIGMVLMGLAQLGFMLTPENSAWGWGIACFVLALGEVIAFPTLNVQIDRLAPAHLRGSYFGAAALASLGFAAAPLLGGLIIGTLNSNWLFGICFLLSVWMIYLYFRVETLTSEPKQNQTVCESGS